MNAILNMGLMAAPKGEGGAMVVMWRVIGLAVIAAFVALGLWVESSGHIPTQVFREMGRSQ